MTGCPPLCYHRCESALPIQGTGFTLIHRGGFDGDTSGRDACRGAIARPGEAPRRQVDFAPGPDSRPPLRRRNRNRGPTRRRRCSPHRRRLRRARRKGGAARQRPLERPGLRDRLAPRPAGNARFRQFGNRDAFDDGRCRRPCDNRHFRWRCLLAKAPDAADFRSALRDGSRGLVAIAGGALPDPAQRDQRARSDHVSSAGCLGADQISGAPCRSQFSRPHDRDRGRGHPRPHRKDAAVFWRLHRDRTVRETRPKNNARRG
jgi:hypothetical protein